MNKRPKTPPAPLDLPLSVRVIYDAKTGHIVHTHYVVVLPHANPPNEEQLDQDALDLARKVGKQLPDHIKLLRVKSEEFKAGVDFHVARDKGKAVLRRSPKPEHD